MKFLPRSYDSDVREFPWNAPPEDIYINFLGLAG